MRFANDELTVRKLRGILATPTLLGREAWSLSDDEILDRAERLCDQIMALAPVLQAAVERVGAAFGKLAADLRELDVVARQGREG